MTEKIAILVSGEGRNAVAITDFFSEGNRISTSCILTDNPITPAAEALRPYGVDTLSYTPDDWALRAHEIVEELKRREVSLVIVDDFELPIPVALLEAFPGGVLVKDDEDSSSDTIEICALSPAGEERIGETASDMVISTPASMADNLWPRAIVAALGRLREKVVPPVPSVDAPPASPEEEWAAALHVDYKPQPPAAPEPGMAAPPAIPPVDNPLPGPQPPFSGIPAQGMPRMQGEKMPPSFMLWSVLSLLFCCFIPSIVAIFYSAKVSTEYYAGNIEKAKQASRKAEIWIIASIVLGVAWMLISLPITILTGL